jgi:hypothetical protein
MVSEAYWHGSKNGAFRFIFEVLASRKLPLGHSGYRDQVLVVYLRAIRGFRASPFLTSGLPLHIWFRYASNCCGLISLTGLLAAMLSLLAAMLPCYRLFVTAAMLLAYWLSCCHVRVTGCHDVT